MTSQAIIHPRMDHIGRPCTLKKVSRKKDIVENEGGTDIILTVSLALSRYQAYHRFIGFMFLS
jgi:hypothetical protein